MNTTTLPVRTFALAAVLSLITAAAPALAQQTVFAPVDHLFIPSGFDNNDSTEVVVTGYLPTPCYERPTAKVKVMGSQIHVRITTVQNTRTEAAQSGPCADVVVPYSEAIRVGRLGAGNYQVLVNQQSTTKQVGALKITLSTIATTDEYPYALVNYVEQKDENEFYLNGYVYSDCFQLEGIRYVSNQKDVISVLPILKKIRASCPRKMTPFRVKMNPPLQTLKSPYFLFHVRSADGKSVNFVGYKK